VVRDYALLVRLTTKCIERRRRRGGPTLDRDMGDERLPESAGGTAELGVLN
jgi:hypothetical protein